MSTQMRLEEQVSSLELSKKLKSLGCKQESYFVWVTKSDGWKVLPDEQFGYKKHISAFTCAELGEMLPPYYFTLRTIKGDYAVIAQGEKEKQYADTLADAMAKMLIYLLEQKLI